MTHDESYRCQDCAGTGEDDFGACPTCYGKGEIYMTLWSSEDD